MTTRFKFKCPECGAVNRVDEEDRGRRVRCQECDERIRVPEEDRDERARDDSDDDRPRKKKRKKPKADNTVLYIILGVGAFVLVLLVGGCGIGGFLVYRGIEAANKFDLPPGKVIFEKNSNLSFTDPQDPHAPGLRMKVHSVPLEAGKLYVISMNSHDFDPYLRLENPKGMNVAEDDDGGGNLNSRIHFRATETGQHRIIATSFNGGTGRYHVAVQEAN